MDKRTRVLLVDDDEDATMIFGEYLDEKGFEIVGTASNGFEAGRLFERFKPDVVLLDIMMPDFDGFYGIDRIREIQQDAKIIVATADVRSETTKKLEVLKPSAILYKPYEMHDLEEALNLVRTQITA